MLVREFTASDVFEEYDCGGTEKRREGKTVERENRREKKRTRVHHVYVRHVSCVWCVSEKTKRTRAVIMSYVWRGV